MYDEMLNKYAALLSTQKRMNEIFEYTEEKLLEERERFEELKEILKKLESIKLLMATASQEHKTKRLGVLTEETNRHLKYLFPEDNFKIKFVPSVFRNKEIVQLYSGQNENALSPMVMNHGRLYRQFVGFITTTVIQEASNCGIFLFDEPFNSGDSETLGDVSKVLKRSLESGNQIILIEHKHEVYETLPRLQYNLFRDKGTNTVEVISKQELEE